MYVSFPKEYFVEVKTMEDFEYNYVGKPIECNNPYRSERTVYEVSEQNNDILAKIDDEYVQNSISK